MHKHYRQTVAGSMLLLTMLLVSVLVGFTVTAQADDFPSHPVRIITDGAPGSAIDVPTRIIGEGLSRIWGQQAVVINQPGAGGAIAARSAATAAPDGYTLGIAAVSARQLLPAERTHADESAVSDRIDNRTHFEA